MVHIHITGASGSGTTSLGRALAEEMALLHLDADDSFWLPPDPPFTTPRSRDERTALLLKSAVPEQIWILSGCAMTWGARMIEPLFDLVVFLRVDSALRMQRMRQRETIRYGARVQPGGDMATKSRNLWSAQHAMTLRARSNAVWWPMSSGLLCRNVQCCSSIHRVQSLIWSAKSAVILP